MSPLKESPSVLTFGGPHQASQYDTHGYCRACGEWHPKNGEPNQRCPSCGRLLRQGSYRGENHWRQRRKKAVVTFDAETEAMLTKAGDIIKGRP